MRLRKFNESSELYTILQKVKAIVDQLSVDNINNFAITLDVNLYTGLYSKAYDYMFYYNGDKFEISDNAGSFYTLKLNGVPVDMGKYPWSSNAPTIEKDLLSAITILYKKINTFYLSKFYKWYRVFFNYLVSHLNEDRKDLIERIEEFEVIRNNQIDWISLNSLYDFYETPFDKEGIRNYFSTKIRNHSITLNEGVLDIFATKKSLLKKYNKMLEDVNINDVDIQEDESLTYFKYVININNNKLEITKYLNVDFLQYSIQLNGKSINTSDKYQMLESQLYRKVRLLSLKGKAIAKCYNNLYTSMLRLIKDCFDVCKLGLSESDISDRLKEFDVIDDNFKKNGNVDIINLEKVFDFYDVDSSKFNTIVQRLKHISIEAADRWYLPDIKSPNGYTIKKLNIIE